MALEKSIIKKEVADRTTFEFKPREIGLDIAPIARDFVEVDAFKSSDFKISELIAQQAGISQLESDAQKDKINAQVLEKLKEVQEEAYKEGHDLGLIEGTEKALQESKTDLQERLRSMDALLKNLESLKKRLMVDNEAELIRLVYLIARKMALRDLEQNREAVLEILSHVVGEMQTDERISVKLSPEDLYFLEGLRDKVGDHIQNFERIKFQADEKVKSGGCLIETEYGSVDASVDERLERTWATLQSRIPQNRDVPKPKTDGDGGKE